LLFIKYSENLEYSLDAYYNIKKDAIRSEKLEEILKSHKHEFHKLLFKDLLITPINHFVTYTLILEEIQKEVVEEDIYEILGQEIEYIKKIVNQMNSNVGESVQIRKFFGLKKIVMGFPADFISSQRKLIIDFDIMGNVRGTFKKHVYLFNDCLMVVSTNKESRKKGFQYVLEKIIYYEKYDFERVEQGTKYCIKCTFKTNDENNNEPYDLRIKNNKKSSFFRTSKDRKPTCEDHSMYMYFENLASLQIFLDE